MVGQATRSRGRRVTFFAESSGARETERDRFCSSDAGAIDAAEGAQHNAGGEVYPRCIVWLVVFVCWSLRCLLREGTKSRPA